MIHFFNIKYKETKKQSRFTKNVTKLWLPNEICYL